VVRVVPIARQRVSKHIPAEAYRGTIGRLFIGGGAVNMPTNCLETAFSMEFVQSGYKRVEFRNQRCVTVENENLRSTNRYNGVSL
jgi:hypothetical protein